MPKIVDHDERRKNIARAVLGVVAREGVRGVTVRTIAEEADWSPGVLSHYFADKQALLVAALREATATVTARMIETESIGDPVARIRAMLEAGMPLDAERTATCRIFYYFQAEGVADEELRAELARNYAAWRRVICELIAQAQTRGRFMGLEPGALAESLVGLAEGLGVQGMFDAKALPPSLLRRRLARTLDYLAAAVPVRQRVGRANSRPSSRKRQR